MRAALFLWKPQYHLQPIYANLSGGQSTVHGACTASPSSGPSWVQVAILVKEETSSAGLSRASKATHSASPGPFHPHSHVQWIFVSEYISLNNKTFITLSSFKTLPFEAHILVIGPYSLSLSHFRGYLSMSFSPFKCFGHPVWLSLHKDDPSRTLCPCPLHVITLANISVVAPGAVTAPQQTLT